MTTQKHAHILKTSYPFEITQLRGISHARFRDSDGMELCERTIENQEILS